MKTAIISVAAILSVLGAAIYIGGEPMQDYAHDYFEAKQKKLHLSQKTDSLLAEISNRNATLDSLFAENNKLRLDIETETGQKITYKKRMLSAQQEADNYRNAASHSSAMVESLSAKLKNCQNGN